MQKNKSQNSANFFYLAKKKEKKKKIQEECYNVQKEHCHWRSHCVPGKSPLSGLELFSNLNEQLGLEQSIS